VPVGVVCFVLLSGIDPKPPVWTVVLTAIGHASAPATWPLDWRDLRMSPAQVEKANTWELVSEGRGAGELRSEESALTYQ
jgi:hypothetical protein